MFVENLFKSSRRKYEELLTKTVDNTKTILIKLPYEGGFGSGRVVTLAEKEFLQICKDIIDSKVTENNGVKKDKKYKNASRLLKAAFQLLKNNEGLIFYYLSKKSVYRLNVVMNDGKHTKHANDHEELSKRLESYFKGDFYTVFKALLKDHRNYYKAYVSCKCACCFCPSPFFDCKYPLSLQRVQDEKLDKICTELDLMPQEITEETPLLK
jgi:hypothetical protein